MLGFLAARDQLWPDFLPITLATHTDLSQIKP